MSKSSLVKYLNLRLVIGYLGEKSQFGWWSTAFYESTSRAFLEPVFPKTYQLAQYNGVKEAGRLLHDKYIGVGSVFHLFRLPEEIEQDLHNLMLEKQKDEVLMSKLKSKDMALEFNQTFLRLFVGLTVKAGLWRSLFLIKKLLEV